METPDRPIAPSAPEAPASPPLPSTPRGWKADVRRPVVWVVLLAILVVAAQWLDTRMQVSGVQQELARRLAESDGQAKEGRLLARQAQNALAELQAKYGALETKVAETQSQALALEAMYQELSSSREERLLAEVEPAVSIAVQQLQFAGNVEAALLALQSAEARLVRASQPRLVALRRILTQDIERLKAAPAADVTGLSLKIESVVAVADSLPLAFEQRPVTSLEAIPTTESTKGATPADQGYWRRLLTDLWHELKQLARLERIDRGDPGLLAPTQSFFLRENMKLRLLNARLALLQRDGKTFRGEIYQTRELLERYFDTRAKSVQAADLTLRQLATADVSADLPRLIESLSVLRSAKLGRETGLGK